MNSVEFNIKIISKRDNMCRLARSILSDDEDALDTVQDVFVRLWSKRDKLDSYNNLEAVLYTAVKNECLDRIRKRKLRSADELTEATTLTTHTQNGRDSVEMGRIAARLIEGLPSLQKSVMTLRDVHGCEMEEIADILGLASAAVRMNLSRARKTVREKLIKIMEYERL